MTATTSSRVQLFKYRASTVLKALKELYFLPQEKIDAFLNSYEIYDHDWDQNQLAYPKVKQKLIDYYCVLNHLCAIGQVEKMYIPPAIDLNANLLVNQRLFEERMAKDLLLKKGSQALDIGCGRGRVANHMAKLTGAHVTGINIDENQLSSARLFAKAENMEDVCTFKQGDVNDIPLPFKDNSLDAIYHIQVFSLSKDLPKLCKDLYRMLKPGGRFACLDWVHLDKYDPKNPEHVDLMRRIKPLIGAIGTPSIKKYTSALEQAGFKVIINENASIDGLQAPLIDNADRFFTRVTKLIRGLVKVKILPQHFNTLFDRLTKDGQAFIKADRMRLVTTSHYIVAEKK
jgi:sterol 24-C-methyltransferase